MSLSVYMYPAVYGRSKEWQNFTQTNVSSKKTMTSIEKGVRVAAEKKLLRRNKQFHILYMSLCCVCNATSAFEIGSIIIFVFGFRTYSRTPQI